MRPHAFALVLVAGCSTSAPKPIHSDPDPTANPAVALLGALPASCSPDRWCWRKPLPRGVPLEAVFATSADNLWLAGEAGYVLQWDGASWREHVLPAPPFRSAMNLGAITGSGPNDIWVAGGNLVYHWDGSAWSLRESIAPEVDQQFHGIWEAPNGDVWLTMEYGIVERSSHGGAFQRIEVPPAQAPLSALGSIWGTAADNVWISGRPGRMFHWDGAKFTEFPTGTLKSGGNLWGASKDDAWVGGYDGTLVHWNGTAWTPVDTGLGDGWYIKGIASPNGDPHDVSWIAQRSSDEAVTLHWDGKALASASLTTDVMVDGLAIVDGLWWVPGDHGGVYVKPAGQTQLSWAIEPAVEQFRTAWGTSDRDMYFGGPDALVHWDGAAWTRPTTGLDVVQSICGSPAGDEVWASGATASGGTLVAGVARFAGGSWSKAPIELTGQVAPSAVLNGVWSPAAGEAIAVGDGGEVYHHTQGSWTPIASPVDADLFAVWGPDADHAWIVGAAGTILRWERSSPGALTVETSPIAADLTAIHGAAGAMWIASNGLGDDHMVGVLERSGTSWIRHAVPHLLGATGVFVRSAGDVSIVGPNNTGRVFRWNGASFTEETTLSAGDFSVVYQPPGGSPWLAGDYAVLQRAP